MKDQVIYWKLDKYIQGIYDFNKPEEHQCFKNNYGNLIVQKYRAIFH